MDHNIIVECLCARCLQLTLHNIRNAGASCRVVRVTVCWQGRQACGQTLLEALATCFAVMPFYDTGSLRDARETLRLKQSPVGATYNGRIAMVPRLITASFTANGRQVNKLCTRAFGSNYTCSVRGRNAGATLR